MVEALFISFRSRLSYCSVNVVGVDWSAKWFLLLFFCWYQLTIFNWVLISYRVVVANLNREINLTNFERCTVSWLVLCAELLYLNESNLTILTRRQKDCKTVTMSSLTGCVCNLCSSLPD